MRNSDPDPGDVQGLYAGRIRDRLTELITPITGWYYAAILWGGFILSAGVLFAFRCARTTHVGRRRPTPLRNL